jgi:hypothetical protein
VDFVVVGFGFAALGVLVGVLLGDAGPRRRRVAPTVPLPAAECERRIAWGRACRAGGRVVTLAGLTVAAVTVLALVVGLGDRAGAVLVMATLALAMVAILGWATVYADRHHPRSLRRGGRPAVPAPVETGPLPLPRAIAAGIARTAAHDRAPVPALVPEPPPAIPVDPVDAGAVASVEVAGDALAVDPDREVAAPASTGPLDATDGGDPTNPWAIPPPSSEPSLSEAPPADDGEDTADAAAAVPSLVTAERGG